MSQRDPRGAINLGTVNARRHPRDNARDGLIYTGDLARKPDQPSYTPRGTREQKHNRRIDGTGFAIKDIHTIGMNAMNRSGGQGALSPTPIDHL
jgi:hypothetical protein